MSRLLALSLLGALAACNQPPEAAGISLTPEIAYTTDDLTLVIETPSVDPNKRDEVSYHIAWTRDGEPVPSLDGAEVVPAAETGKGELWEVTVTPADDKVEGSSSTASLAISNTPPEAQVELSVEVPRTDEPIVAVGSATDADEDAVELRWSWTRDGEPTEHDGDTVPASATARGEIWEVTLVAFDGEEQGEPVTAQASIANVAPAITSVRLVPDAVFTTTTVEAVVEAEDVDGDAISLDYAWYVDDALVLEGDAPALPDASFDKGAEVYVVVTPNDGSVDGEPVTSDPIVVSNSAPTLASAALDPTEISEETEVTCVPSGASDPDGDPVSFTYQWFVGGVAASTGPTLSGDAFDKGDEIWCMVTPTDGTDAGAPVTTATATAVNTPPDAGVVRITPDAPHTNDTLSLILTDATDADGDAITYSYQWYVGGAAASTGPTLSGDAFDKHDEIWAVVTPTDGTDAGAPATTATVTVANTPPVATSVSISPSTPTTGTTLQGTASGSDADGDALTWSYAWYVDDVLVEDVTDSSLSGATWFDKYQDITLVVTPNDGEADGGSIEASVMCENTAPTAPVAVIEPEEPVEGLDDLWCGVETPAADADGDTISYRVSWTVDGSPFTDTTTSVWPGDTVPASATAPEEEWECTLFADDGDASSSATASATVLPELVPLDSLCGKVTDGLFCGGNCTSNTAEYADAYCRMGGFDHAASYVTITSGTVGPTWYYNKILPTSCSELGWSSYGTASYCTCVSDLVCSN